LVSITSHLFLFFSFYSSCDLRDLHSFPTRRSSDLENLSALLTGITITDVIQAFAATIGIIISLIALWQSKKSIKLTEKSIREAKDRKSTRLNSSHVSISYAVFCLKKKKKT